MQTNAGANVTLRAVILDPLSHKDLITVVGTVVLVDLGIERMDLSHDGAKLAVQLDHLDEASRRVVVDLSVADRPQVSVNGSVRKQQRRTFLQAASVSMAHSPAGRCAAMAERIAALPCWEGEAVEVKPATAVAQELALGEGRTNQNFVVRRRGGAGHFVRVGADLPFFGVSRAREQAASRAAAATGLAPAVVLTSDDLLVRELPPCCHAALPPCFPAALLPCCPAHRRLQAAAPEAATAWIRVGLEAATRRARGCDPSHSQGCGPMHQVLELVPGRALTEADMRDAARARTPLLATVTWLGLGLGLP
jgi:hypothetical protein